MDKGRDDHEVSGRHKTARCHEAKVQPWRSLKRQAPWQRRVPMRTEDRARAATRRRLEGDIILVATAATCLVALGIALLSQHQFNMQPCPWCSLQRLIFCAIALSTLPCLVWRHLSRSGTKLMLVAPMTLCGCGIASALWQHFVAASSASCSLTFADRILSATRLDSVLPEIFLPRASCSEGAVALLGVPYEFWSLAAFAGIGAALMWLWKGERW
jgi:protein dithiol:quinone oxidoreductase